MLDQVQFGSRRGTRRRWPRWALAGLAAAVIATLVVIHQGHHHPPRRPGLLAPVRDVGHRMLGVTAGWQLATYGPDGLIRIQPAASPEPPSRRWTAPGRSSSWPGPTRRSSAPWTGCPAT
jgi:hypothetical protein